MKSVEESDRLILRDVYEHLRTTGRFPESHPFRMKHEHDRRVIDRLVEDRLLRHEFGAYELTPTGLEACGVPEIQLEFEAFNRLIPVLKQCYREQPYKSWTAAEIANRVGQAPESVGRTMTLFYEFLPYTTMARNQETHFVDAITLWEKVLDLQSLIRPLDRPRPPETTDWRIRSLHVHGYRAFRDFRASFENLNVIIGANSTGKSTLLDFLRFLSFAASNPLPPEIDPFALGRMPFHVDGPPRISFSLEADLGGEPGVVYEAEIKGPGAPRIAYERMRSVKPLQGLPFEYPFMNFTDGKGEIRDPAFSGFGAEQWNVEPNELALRRALHPKMHFVSTFREFVSSWRDYSALKVPREKLALPALTEPEPKLSRDGANLAAVLLSLATEHRELWGELETHLRSAVPGFKSLSVRPRGGRGTVLVGWRERDVSGELTLAELSDGVLLFLSWATLCLSPTLPPVVCIDEPELGLHPRALPILAGLLKLAATRSQVIVTTHSPYLLSQFALDEIAVMRRDNSKVVFLRPATSKALQHEIAELGGDALARMHISDELEARS